MSYRDGLVPPVPLRLAQLDPGQLSLAEGTHPMVTLWLQSSPSTAHHPRAERCCNTLRHSCYSSATGKKTLSLSSSIFPPAQFSK